MSGCQIDQIRGNDNYHVWMSDPPKEQGPLSRLDVRLADKVRASIISRCRMDRRRSKDHYHVWVSDPAKKEQGPRIIMCGCQMDRRSKDHHIMSGYQMDRRRSKDHYDFWMSGGPKEQRQLSCLDAKPGSRLEAERNYHHIGDC